MISDEVKAEILYDALADDKLELTLFPTEHCNFRCTYCYEDFSIGRMTPEIVNAVKRLIEVRSDDLHDLYISWFGGEPLVAYDIVREVNEFALQMSQRRDPSDPLRLHIGMTTNGYALSEARLTELHASGVRRYQISFDGISKGHDATRKRADGGATFDVIWKNVLKFNEMREQGALSGASVMLRLHIHPENIRSAIDFAEIVAENLNPDWFSILIKNVGHYGGKNDKTFPVFDPLSQEYKDGQIQLRNTLKAFFPANTSLEHIPVCYAGKANAFTIRADGRIGKCTVALNSKSNVVGILAADGRLELDGPAAGKWLHALKSMSIEDLGCPIGNLHNA